MALGGDLWNAKGKLEVDLAVVAGRSFGKCREKIKSFGELDTRCWRDTHWLIRMRYTAQPAAGNVCPVSALETKSV